MKLAGKTAIVTGGTRGIGKAVVWALAREGAKVAFVYTSSDDVANQLVKDLELDQRVAAAYKADVRSRVEADQVVEKVIAAWGQVDILVNNAGIIRDNLLAMMDETAWNDVIQTNLTSVYNYCHAVIRPMMSARKGRIINMSSVASEFGNAGQVNYAASKGGIEGLTKCLATEVARRGITVNAVAPGFIETDMTTAVRNAAADKIKDAIPCRRFGKPEDIAAAVLFLATDDASYITGQVIKVDGGLTLGGM